MLDYLKLEDNKTLTENGAATYKTTGSDMLDLFATIGALRNSREDEIVIRFIRAYSENSELAMKLLFFTRDIRGGLGERRVFRIIFRWLAENDPDVVIKNISFIEEFGRYDDFLVLLHTKCEHAAINFLKAQLEEDVQHCMEDKPVSLLAKWLPSANTSNVNTVKNAKKLAREFGMTQEQYRKTIVTLRRKIDLIENHLREKDYVFDYAKVPSRAQFKYRNAFLRNDKMRYLEFIEAVNQDAVTMHTDHVMPYEFVETYLQRENIMTNDEKEVLNTAWKALPDFGSEENAIAVVDTSGSMYWGGKPTPASVALSLGIYFAERNSGVFHNYFIEFSEQPQLIELKGETFAEKLQYVMTFNKVADTNLEAVFDLILKTAIKYHVQQKDLPSKLVIISDMEFNTCMLHADKTNFENTKHKYERYGYKLPEIVFWNVASRNCQQPVTMNEHGTILVSGCSVHLFEMVAGRNLSPYQFMLDVLQSSRYAKISA